MGKAFDDFVGQEESRAMQQQQQQQNYKRVAGDWFFLLFFFHFNRYSIRFLPLFSLYLGCSLFMLQSICINVLTNYFSILWRGLVSMEEVWVCQQLSI